MAKGEGPGYGLILRAGNGWYLLHSVKRGDTIIQGMILLKHEYSVQNEFLSNRFQDDFKMPSAVSISLENTGNKIFSANGTFLFSLVFPEEKLATPGSSPLQETLMLLCFIIAIILLVVFLKRLYDKFTWLIRGAGWRFLLFTTDVVILRLIQFYFRIPGPLYDTELFGPALYSSSAFFPSLGDLVINITLLVLLSFIFCREMTSVSFKEKRGSSKIVAVAIPLLIIPAGLAAGCWFLYDFIINSSFSLNLQDISGLNWTSLYGLVIIWGIWVTLFLVFMGILQRSGFLSGNGPGENPRPAAIFISLIFAAAITTVISNYSNDYKEKEKRKILAVKLASTRNPVTEILFSQLEKRILSDKRVIEIAEETDFAGNGELQNDSIGRIIMSHMTSEYWAKFNVQITLCTENKKLMVQPQGYLVGCNEYFTKVIRDFGSKTLSEHLFFLDLGFGYENYLAVLPLPVEINGRASVLPLYLEINSKYIYKDLGYPELLINKKVTDFPDISDYSCAFYQNTKLFHRLGKYAFCFDLEHYLDNSNGEIFFVFDGMNHYHYQINQANDLIISKKQESFLTIISPFSYLFLFMGLATVIFVLLTRLPAVSGFSAGSLRLRLQTATMGILLISFIIIGLVVIVNIVRLTSNKNADYLNEKTMSIFVEFQHKFGNSDNLTESGHEELENLLVKLSNVFFTDINIYDGIGQIVASSRPQVFDESLISTQIDPEAYWNLKHEKSSIFIHQEKIGSYSYSSTYIPLYNDRNVFLGYINLPFFSRQDEIKKEISSFLVAFINIYLLLILIGILIAYFVSKYITAPLQLLANKIGHLKLGATNEKIQWERRDEIGKLVDEYNRMIQELGESVEKLTRSEREGAWREMAKQVAHEIKNPLTPMKLSVQYLQKAWDEKTPDWDKRLEKFTRTLTDQIEALSVIATEFSDFAKMPLPVIEKIDVSEVIEASLGIYQNQENIDFITEHPRERPFISGDRKQLIRLFTNLFNNSVEAIGKEKKGEIRIGIERRDDMWIVEITDSGGGITSDQAEKIFQPYFTTKSGGTGLGLAIVK
ncbi:MAG: ATP-binding protein, partial [bacterium]